MKVFLLFRLFQVIGLCTILILPGCATPMLWRAAEGLGEATLRLEVLKLNGAYKVSADEVHVCMRVSDLDTHRESEMTVSIPLRNRERWTIRPGSGNSDDAARGNPLPAGSINTYVEFRPTPSDLSPNCLAEGKQLPILQATVNVSSNDSKLNQGNPSFEFPKDVSEAIYTINRKGFPANIGYVSKQPIVEHGYAIDVPVDYFRAVRTKGDAKPYLYLLTPVTVVIDAAIGVVVLIGSGHDNAAYRYSPTSSGSK